MKKHISAIMAAIITAATLPAMNSLALLTVFTEDSEQYIKYIEQLDNSTNLERAPEIVSLLPTIYHADQPNALITSEVTNAWVSKGSTADSTGITIEYKIPDGFYVDIVLKKDKENDIDAIVNDIKKQLGYNDKIDITSELKVNKVDPERDNRLQISGLFNSYDHKLNTMISEKAYSIINQQYDALEFNVAINNHQFVTGTLFNTVVIPNREATDNKNTRSYLDYDMIDHDMLKEKYNAVYDNETHSIILPDDSSISDKFECLYYFASNFGTYTDGQFQASAQNFGSEINIEESAYCFGDANLDGTLSLADALSVLQFIANEEKYPLNAQQQFNADCYNSGDGITAMDALAIQNLDTGKIDSLLSFGY